jgi:hypothetical protein
MNIRNFFETDNHKALYDILLASGCKVPPVKLNTDYYEYSFKNEKMREIIYNKSLTVDNNQLFLFDIDGLNCSSISVKNIQNKMNKHIFKIENDNEEFHQLFNVKDKTFMFRPHSYILVNNIENIQISHMNNLFKITSEIMNSKQYLTQNIVIIYEILIKTRKIRNKKRKYETETAKEETEIPIEEQAIATIPEIPIEKQEITTIPEITLIKEPEITTIPEITPIEEPKITTIPPIEEPETPIIPIKSYKLINISFNCNSQEKYITKLLSNLNNENEKFRLLSNQYNRLIVWNGIHTDRNNKINSLHFTANFISKSGSSPNLHFYITDDKITSITQITNLI